LLFRTCGIDAFDRLLEHDIHAREQSRDGRPAGKLARFHGLAQGGGSPAGPAHGLRQFGQVANLQAQFGQLLHGLAVLVIDQKAAQGMLVQAPKLGRAFTGRGFNRGQLDIEPGPEELGFVEQLGAGRTAQIIDRRQNHDRCILLGAFQVIQVIRQDCGGFQHLGNRAGFVGGLVVAQSLQRPGPWLRRSAGRC
jgi:hypothetical protein